MPNQNKTTSYYLKQRSTIDGVRRSLCETEQRLEEIFSIFRMLLADDHFLTLLRAEGLNEMPKCIRELAGG